MLNAFVKFRGLEIIDVRPGGDRLFGMYGIGCWVIEVVFHGSSNGRTRVFGTRNVGSTPTP